MSLQIATFTTKTGIVMANPVLKIVRLSYDALIRKTANGPRAAVGTKAKLKGLNGQLAVYPTLVLSQPVEGKAVSDPVEMVPFNIPDITKLPAGTNILAQVYDALVLQPKYKGATTV